MGGIGSGRLSWRSTLEQRLSLDVRDLKRKDLLRCGRSFSWSWSIGDKETARIGVRVGDDEVTLDYSCCPYGERDWRPVKQRVRLGYSASHFGGRRVWFVCPACVGWAARLFFAHSTFVCRRCCGFPYTSQQESVRDRATRKARKIRNKLGASPIVGDPIYEKPKGMHWATFERLKARAEDADDLAKAHLLHFAWRLISKYR